MTIREYLKGLTEKLNGLYFENDLDLRMTTFDVATFQLAAIEYTESCKDQIGEFNGI
jgi:hypothetical protein